MCTSDLVERIRHGDETDLDLGTDCKHVALPQVDDFSADREGCLIGNADIDALDDAIQSICPVACESENVILCCDVAGAAGCAGSRVACSIDSSGIERGLAEEPRDSTFGDRINEDRSLTISKRKRKNRI